MYGNQGWCEKWHRCHYMVIITKKSLISISNMLNSFQKIYMIVIVLYCYDIKGSFSATRCNRETATSYSCSSVSDMASDHGIRENGALDISTVTSKHNTIDEVREAKVEDDLVEPQEGESGFDWTWKSLMQKPADLDAIATLGSVFDDPELAKYYNPGPEYENYHRFDRNERWTYREQRAVRRKIDFRILLWVLMMFFGLNIDRGNLGLAVAGNLLTDLELSTNDYNNAQNMYRVGFIIAEIPSQLVERLGPDRWIPIQIIIWSICAGGQFFMQRRAEFFACRFFIGLLMGGFNFYKLIFYYFYNSKVTLLVNCFL